MTDGASCSLSLPAPLSSSPTNMPLMIASPKLCLAVRSRSRGLEEVTKSKAIARLSSPHICYLYLLLWQPQMSYSEVVKKIFGSHWSLVCSRSVWPKMMIDISKGIAFRQNISSHTFGVVEDFFLWREYWNRCEEAGSQSGKDRSSSNT